MEAIQRQVRQRIPQKFNWKRPVLFCIMELEKNFLRVFSSRYGHPSNSDLSNPTNDVNLGVDEFGRSVSFYVKIYVRLLLKRGVKLHTLIVLGSRAKNRAIPKSDVDVMIIASELPGRSSPEFPNIPQKILSIRRSFLLSDAPLFIGIQPSACCSKEELLNWLGEFKISALDAVYYGKVMYDDGFWKQVLAEFRKIEHKYGLDSTEIKKLLISL